MSLRRRAIFIHTAGPDVALIKSGGRSRTQVVIGGRMLSIPIFQRIDALSLALRTISVRTTHGLTINGVAVDVNSTCQVKISSWSTASDTTVPHPRSANIGAELKLDYAAVRLAAQHFLGKNDQQMEDAIQKTIAGHQRAIIGGLTVEELYRDRAAFCKRVLDLCSDDMRSMGLTVVSYVVAEISDENGYIEALGVTQTELVKREASEGSAIHRAQARIQNAKQEADSHLLVNKQAEVKIESDKRRSVTQAKAQEEVLRREAIQNRAHEISTAEQDAVLFVKRQKARAAETEAELDVMRQEVQREKLEKEKRIHVDADAQLYRAEVTADAIRKTAKAEADKLTMIGQAEAEATRAKGMAEIDILRERNKIWQETANYGAIMEKLIEILPKVAKAVAEPLSKTEKMVFISSGSGPGGPSRFTDEMNRMVAEVPETLNALTGFDLREAVTQMMQGQTGSAVVQGAAEGVATALVDKGFKAK